MRIVIIGATSAIAEHCARIWASRSPSSFVLVGRDVGRMERIAEDLRVRGPHVQVDCLQADFLDPVRIRETVDGICNHGRADLVLIAHGSLPDQQQCQDDLTACHMALEVNGTSPVLFAEAFAAHMARTGSGTLAVIGSVAGDRGRRSNYVYGAAKGLVTRYVQGLQHRFASTGVKAVLIKPGPTDTPMTAGIKQKGARLASVQDVAACIVQGIERGRPVIYAPGKWALIMMVIRHMPRFVFNRMNI
ncbi:short chain dehydrogenase [Bordetella ansorpii]|uniref:Short chain dehydrogenase n=1 Tax=Bordetella ansorpii TaxID=288768 RepID=A0A157S9S3_9BORD|nr:SDR family NAD(P)-dependent oxidoreductase [Bordetella ansorpii]SAI67114.1 short chain dehydrogenase [Bordetella ansorpii]